jgi:DNA damage-binding protein 1
VRRCYPRPPFCSLAPWGPPSCTHRARAQSTIIRAGGRVDSDGARASCAPATWAASLCSCCSVPPPPSLAWRSITWARPASIASTLSYLDGGVVCVGSASADSQLLRLNAAKDPDTGSYLEVLDSVTNLGPIVDMSCVDRKGWAAGR